MEMLIGGIALVVWLLIMVPAAFICFSPSDPTIAPDRLPATLAHLPRPDSTTEDDRLAA